MVIPSTEVLTWTRILLAALWIAVGLALLRFFYRAYLRTGAKSMVWLAIGFELVIITFSLRPILIPLMGGEFGNPAFSVFEGVTGLIGIVVIFYSTYK